MNNEIGKIYTRPWGTYQTIALTDNYQVKILTINPNGHLSLQKHSKCSEHWTIVKGDPTITIDETVKTYPVNSHIFIPVGAAHRIENVTATPAVIIEVQIGPYLGEDDIIKIPDVYGRA
jgi:mannose-6-phosphate isomerase